MPYVGDSKRALDEYTSEIALGGTNTIVIHNTCEVGVHLASPWGGLVCVFASMSFNPKGLKLQVDKNQNSPAWSDI